METAARIVAILRSDPRRWHLLGVVAALNLPDGWIAAGFVRNAVWDHLHGRRPSVLSGDVDVIWHDPACNDPRQDRRHEATLCAMAPDVTWSVKNQARMHVRNDDAPYASAIEAMRFWPETATAVAARRIGETDCEVAAPLGLNDLTKLILRPTLRFVGEKRQIYEERVRSKGWKDDWPLMRDAAAGS